MYHDWKQVVGPVFGATDYLCDYGFRKCTSHWQPAIEGVVWGHSMICLIRDCKPCALIKYALHSVQVVGSCIRGHWFAIMYTPNSIPVG
jgi:hypothetical protein